MALHLTIIKSPGDTSLAETAKTIGDTGITIGRGQNNHWVLPDAERIVSGNHCEIIVENNQYFVLDLSANGTFVNGSPEPLGRGNQTGLNDGDQFEVGDYRFSVSVQSASATAGASPFGAQADTMDAAFNSVAPSLEGFGDISPSPPEALEALEALNPLLNPPASEPVISAEPTLDPVAQEKDPLALLDGKVKEDKVGMGQVGMGQVGIDQVGVDQDDFFNTDAFPSAPPPPSGSQSDNIGTLDQAFTLPKTTEDSHLIPENWFDDPGAGAGAGAEANDIDRDLADLIGDDPPVAPAKTDKVTPSPDITLPQPVAEPSSPAPVQPQSTVETTARINKAPTVPTPATPAPAAPTPASSVVDIADKPSSDPGIERHGRHTPRQPEPVPPPPVRQSAREDATPDPQPTVGHRDRSLIDALGIGDYPLTDQQIDKIHQLVGELTRETLIGLMQIMRARANIKKELRMGNITTIQPVENNPLKFSPSIDDALEYMFVKQRSAYKKPVAAVREVHDGIEDDQLAFLAGMRSAFNTMLECFNPTSLERQFERQTSATATAKLIPSLGKGKYWNAYTEHYKNLTDNMDNTFQELFATEFVRAYEDQLRKSAHARQQRREP